MISLFLMEELSYFLSSSYSSISALLLLPTPLSFSKKKKCASPRFPGFCYVNLQSLCKSHSNSEERMPNAHVALKSTGHVVEGGAVRAGFPHRGVAPADSHPKAHPLQKCGFLFSLQTHLLALLHLLQEACLA